MASPETPLSQRSFRCLAPFRNLPPDEPAHLAGAAAGSGAFDEGRLRAVLPQLVSALGTIHDAGHLHRDVKPSNVLVSNEGRLVLLDFGLVTALRASEQSSDAELEGTPAFMAPEQVEGGGVGPAADWYAVGVMLFAALTGRLPFEGSISDILERKLTHEAPRARSISPHAPEDLDALCAALLRMAPADRPAAAEIRARLGMSAEEASSAPMRAEVFIGREHELAALGRALADVERQVPRAS